MNLKKQNSNAEGDKLLSNRKSVMALKKRRDLALRICLALSVIVVFSLVICSLVIMNNNGKPSGLSLSAPSVEEMKYVCDTIPSALQDMDELDYSIPDEEIYFSKYLCVAHEVSRDGFQVLIGNRSLNDMMKVISDEYPNDEKYQSYLNRVGGAVEYFYGSGVVGRTVSFEKNEDSNDYFFGRMKFESDNQVTYGDYVVAFDNVIVTASSEKLLKEFNFIK